MSDTRISRRAALLGAGAVAAWAASPARALLAQGDGVALPASVEAILARMTLEEKAGQLQLNAAAWGGGVATALNPPSNGPSFEGQLADAVAGKLTGVFNGNGAEMARRMQGAVMRNSRLKIPLIFAADVIHGHRTIFPVPVAEAASFEPDLAMRTARMAAFEAAAAGIDWTFFPMVDIARDQRWGRTMEGAGEDVLLGNLFAAARVKGFQGKSLSADDAVMACIKHFAAYGAGESGLDYNIVDLSERTLREVYLPPYKAGFDAGAMSGMASFNEIDGIPSTGNPWLMKQVLRDEWKFPGIIVSDYTGDEEMIAAGFAKDGKDAARLAFLAGVDMSMQSNLYALYLPELVREGAVPQEVLDRSVRRVLAVKQMLGLFDDPFRRIDRKRETARSRTKAALALSREAAQKAMVLLKNDGDLLPLDPNRRIALIGPFASGQHDLNGPWVVYGDNNQAIDLVTGLRDAGAKNVTVTPGSGVEQALPGGIEAAVAAAQAADVVVLAIGESEVMSGEAQSRTSITVPAPQMALAEAVAQAVKPSGKPIVVLLKNGRGLALEGAVKDAPAILVTWFLGSETGHAIADILFGKVGPSGRLPLSFPHESGQEPYYYAHKATGRPAPEGPRVPYKTQWRTAPNAALYPFGHGLTYGKVSYGAAQVPASLPWDGRITVSATVTNGGTRPCEEVVQLYIRDRVASITRPVREMKAFRKVALAPGQSEVVSFTLTRPQLEFLGRDLRPTVEPGTFDVWIAPSAQDEGAHGTFDLIR
ncbi:glycoside hydrolase family 3 N-terminal domain-containing protein [Sphingomonas sp. NCPPB 2930]|uniref:glycoside hydrolase family 3 N-terminal domain-containing protein n=1 Tax=Sphingomonas sp. NCPPB 2930 TaxID=3162788 RepID=UPI0036DCB025